MGNYLDSIIAIIGFLMHPSAERINKESFAYIFGMPYMLKITDFFKILVSVLPLSLR